MHMPACTHTHTSNHNVIQNVLYLHLTDLEVFMLWVWFISLVFINLFYHFLFFYNPQCLHFPRVTVILLDSKGKEWHLRAAEFTDLGLSATWFLLGILDLSKGDAALGWCLLAWIFLKSQGSVAMSMNCGEPLCNTSNVEHPWELPCPSNPSPRQWAWTSWCFGFSVFFF